jgi:hypothetical protein
LHQIRQTQQHYNNMLACNVAGMTSPSAHHMVQLYLVIDLPQSYVPSLVIESCDSTNPKGPSIYSITSTELRLQESLLSEAEPVK